MLVLYTFVTVSTILGVMEDNAMSIITARIDDELEMRLANLAKSVDRKKSYFVRKAIEMSIEDLEDIYEAEAVVLKIREGKEKTYTLDEVKQELDLAD